MEEPDADARVNKGGSSGPDTRKDQSQGEFRYKDRSKKAKRTTTLDILKKIENDIRTINSVLSTIFWKQADWQLKTTEKAKK